MGKEARVDPLDRIEWVPAEELDPNTWNPNRVMKPELRLLERSILTQGWIQPILAGADGTIIDGFHRWRLAQDSKPLMKRYGGKVPIVRLDLDRAHSMLLTVRINRAKGIHSARHMSALVRALVEDHGWELEQIAGEIGADMHEVGVLASEGVFAEKGIKKWAYSQAWYPVEAAMGSDPNADGLHESPLVGRVPLDDPRGEAQS